MRSLEAYSFSCETLFRHQDHGYLWTVTAPDVVPTGTISRYWNRVQKSLVRTHQLHGIRAFEMHPGGHGLHVHFITPTFFDVGSLRKVAERAGFGRVHVRGPMPAPVATYYLVPYIMKQRRRTPAMKGLRLWAAFGDWNNTPCSKVEFESEWLDRFRAMYRKLETAAPDVNAWTKVRAARDFLYYENLAQNCPEIVAKASFKGEVKTMFDSVFPDYPDDSDTGLDKSEK